MKSPRNIRPVIRDSISRVLNRHCPLEWVNGASEVREEVACVSVCAVDDFSCVEGAAGGVEGVHIWV